MQRKAKWNKQDGEGQKGRERERKKLTARATPPRNQRWKLTQFELSILPNQIDLCSLVRDVFWLSCCVGSVCRRDTLTSRMKLSVKLSKFMASIKHCSNEGRMRRRSETTEGETCAKSVQRLKSRQRSFFFCHTEALAGAGFACFWWWKIEKMKVNVDAKKKKSPNWRA